MQLLFRLTPPLPCRYTKLALTLSDGTVYPITWNTLEMQSDTTTLYRMAGLKGPEGALLKRPEDLCQVFEQAEALAFCLREDPEVPDPKIINEVIYIDHLPVTTHPLKITFKKEVRHLTMTKN